MKVAPSHLTRTSKPQLPTRTEFLDLFTKDPTDRVRIGEDTPPSKDFQSMAEAKEALRSLSYHESLDPFVATVAGGIYAGKADAPEGAETLKLKLPLHYQEDFEVEFGNQHGPGAPVLVILPGVYAGRDSGFGTLLKKTAHERGMNYLVIPNPLGQDALDDKPIFHPGNPALESEIVLEILEDLKNQMPDYFDKVSLAGYSYGALLGANAVRHDEEQNPGEDRLITGGLFAVSPPQDLYDSMRELDGLREHYAEGAGSIVQTVLKYKKDVKDFGYQNFPLSELAQRGAGTNITEIKISDHYGSRDEMKDMVASVDRHFGHDSIPRWGRERGRILDAMTYHQYSEQWASKDAWLVERGFTPESLADEYSFQRAMDEIGDTPIMTLVSADDYIINAENVSTFRDLASQEQPLEATMVLENGGHVGTLFNPQVRGTLADFVYSTAAFPDLFST